MIPQYSSLWCVFNTLGCHPQMLEVAMTVSEHVVSESVCESVYEPVCESVNHSVDFHLTGPGPGCLTANFAGYFLYIL